MRWHFGPRGKLAGALAWSREEAGVAEFAVALRDQVWCRLLGLLAQRATEKVGAAHPTARQLRIDLSDRGAKAMLGRQSTHISLAGNRGEALEVGYADRNFVPEMQQEAQGAR